MASGDPEDFRTRLTYGNVSFDVRLGDGATYSVYLSVEKAAELAEGLARLGFSSVRQTQALQPITTRCPGCRRSLWVDADGVCFAKEE